MAPNRSGRLILRGRKHARRPTDEIGSSRTVQHHMAPTSQSDYRPEPVDTLVLVGTTKGLFALRSGDGREEFELDRARRSRARRCTRRASTPAAPAPAAVHRIGEHHWGPVLRRSDDLGATLDRGRTGIARVPRPAATPSLARIWQLTPGPADQPDVAVRRRRAGGAVPQRRRRRARFELVRGLWDHPHRPQWEPGGGGLCLHTVLVHPDDPDRLLIADLGGRRLPERRRRRDVAGQQPRHPRAVHARQPELEFGQCVHKVARDAGEPERLYLQHHGGIYRSDDGGASWTAMTGIAGMDFGFPVVAHPTRPDTAYLLPLESDEYRCTPDGRCTVWRTSDAGCVVGAADQRACPRTRRPRHGAARCVHHRRRRPGRPLLRHPHRRGLRLDRRRRLVAAARRPPARPCCPCAPRRSADGPIVVQVRDARPRSSSPTRAARACVGRGGCGRSPSSVAPTAASADAVTVAAVLDALAVVHPALERRVRDELGRTRVHVNLFVGTDNVRDLDGLATPIPPGTSCRSSRPCRAADEAGRRAGCR